MRCTRGHVPRIHSEVGESKEEHASALAGRDYVILGHRSRFKIVISRHGVRINSASFWGF